MYDAFLFDVQVRYALGYHNLGEGAFELRTVYNFRNRLSEHMQKTGENLLDGTFASASEIPGRAIADIPHPLMPVTRELFKGRRAQLWFIHLNHTNRELDAPDVALIAGARLAADMLDDPDTATAALLKEWRAIMSDLVKASDAGPLSLDDVDSM
jgi:hypothetical protein